MSGLYTQLSQAEHTLHTLDDANVEAAPRELRHVRLAVQEVPAVLLVAVAQDRMDVLQQRPDLPKASSRSMPMPVKQL
eukprot:COSAG01_NODE_6950_length_3424_cov_3.280301_3_plen_78_part_00